MGSMWNNGSIGTHRLGADELKILRMELLPCSRRKTLKSCSIMKRRELLDLYFIEARSKLIDVAAFLDRFDRSEGEPDFRLSAFTQALDQLQRGDSPRVERMLASLSDPTIDPIPAATTKAACGAWPGTH